MYPPAFALTAFSTSSPLPVASPPATRLEDPACLQAVAEMLSPLFHVSGHPFPQHLGWISLSRVSFCLGRGCFLVSLLPELPGRPCILTVTGPVPTA